ncbi:MAG: tripartite tricarboxylate transporter substrate binding protein [Burkholderiales bacterium]|nr:tripartite tricarboxylate transporter substrate binding protein [Burkholderiales bacterium]
MPISRRFIVAGLAGLSLALPAGASWAQDFPKRQITMVVPFAAGGSTDLVARLLAQKLTEQMGVNVIVENRAGAGGNIGAAAVAKAEPDGYTVLYGTISTHTLNPLMAKRSAYDPVKDFEPIALVGSIPNVMIVHPSVPAKDVKELIAAAKADPAKFSYASSGVATPLHLSGEMFNRMAGTQMAHVPYRGAGPAMNDLIAGQVPVMFDNLPTSIEQIKAGKARALGVTTKERVKQMPDIPTLHEQGLTGYETYSWQALFAPAKTPKAVVDRINAEVIKALKDPALLKRLDELTMTVTPSSPEGLGKHVVEQLATWGPITKATGVQLD